MFKFILNPIGINSISLSFTVSRWLDENEGDKKIEVDILPYNEKPKNGKLK
jgi:hypothetical protein